MRAWRQGEVHLLVKEQVDTQCNTNTIIKISQECEAPAHQDPQECAVKAVRLERLVGAVNAPRSFFSFKNLITRYISIYLHCCGLDLREEFQTNGKHLKAFVIKGGGGLACR